MRLSAVSLKLGDDERDRGLPEDCCEDDPELLRWKREGPGKLDVNLLAKPCALSVSPLGRSVEVRAENHSSSEIARIDVRSTG